MSGCSARRMVVILLGLIACRSDPPVETTPSVPEAQAAVAPEPASAVEPARAVEPAAAAPSCERCSDTACAPADARACSELAEKHLRGQGVPFDLAKHGDLAEKACVHGYGPACSKIAILHQDGIGGREHSDAKAAEWHERGCKAGAGIGCFNLAVMIEGGESGPADPDRAKPWFDKAFAAFQKSCDEGEHEWCANVGYMLEAGHGVPADHAAAAAAYDRGCPEHPFACAGLALMRIDGAGTDKDVEGGRKLLEDGCEAGSSWCCLHLGRHLLQGPTLADNERGVAYLQRACAAKEKLACATLAAAYGTARGVAADPARAMELLEEACSLGDSSACREAAMQIVERNDQTQAPRVRALLEQACRIYDPGACHAAGLMYTKGAGGPADPERAREAFADACRRGDPDGCDEVIRLGLEPDVIASRRAAVFDHACQRGVKSACDAVRE